MSSFVVKPILDNVICRKVKAEEKRESGLIIPRQFDDDETAEVIAVGPGKWANADGREPMSVVVGDRVIYNKHQKQDLRIMGEDYFTCKDEHLRMIVNR